MTWPTNITITGLIKNIIAVVGNIAENTININHKAIIEALMEIRLKVITKRNTMFIKS
jgi:hypothetical protein